MRQVHGMFLWDSGPSKTACVPSLPQVPALHAKDPLVAALPGNGWIAMSFCHLTRLA